MNSIIREDIESIVKDSISWEKLKDSTVLITGFKGMIGSYMTRVCLYLNEKRNYNIKVIGITRTPKGMDEEFIDNPSIRIIYQDVTEPLDIDEKVDWVVHAASPASPAIMKNDPVGTIGANTLGTWNALQVANRSRSKGFIFISSREIYGQPYDNQEEFHEDTYGLVDPLEARSCYPEGKKAAETMCVCFREQYGLNTKIARLAHTYGPGMSIYDGRVQADFLRNALNKEDIIMKSTGTAVRTYTYIADAISAIYRILLDSDDIVYNIGDSNNRVTIRDLAETIVKINPEDNLKVIMDIPEENLKGVSPFTLGILNSDKIQAIGWKPRYSVFDGFSRTLKYLEMEETEGYKKSI